MVNTAMGLVNLHRKSGRIIELFMIPLVLSLSKGRPFAAGQAHHERDCLLHIQD